MLLSAEKKKKKKERKPAGIFRFIRDAGTSPLVRVGDVSAQ